MMAAMLSASRQNRRRSLPGFGDNAFTCDTLVFTGEFVAPTRFSASYRRPTLAVPCRSHHDEGRDGRVRGGAWFGNVVRQW